MLAPALTLTCICVVKVCALPHTCLQDTVRPIPVTEPSTDIAAYKSVVGCGCAHGDVIVKVVHPETLQELPQWHVGEVWVSSPSRALGYFDDPVATVTTFEAQISRAFPNDTAEVKYLRTGDLGFVGDDELYITGRLKNILIIRGQNYYLQDFEEVVEKCPHIRKGCAMAFSVRSDEAGLESLGVAAEVERSVTLLPELQAIAEQLRSSISQVFQLPVHYLWLTEAGTLPKTTSGKPRRNAAREMLEKGSCQGILYCSVSHQSGDAPDRPLLPHREFIKRSELPDERAGVELRAEHCAPLPVQNMLYSKSRQMRSDASILRSDGKAALVERQKPYLVRTHSVEEAVLECFREVFGINDLPIEQETSLGTLNLDSLSAVELTDKLTKKLNVKVQPFAFFDCPNIGSVVTTVKNILLHEDRVNGSPARQLVGNVKLEPHYEIYITGMACKLPRGCDNPADFWARLLQRDQFIGAPPPGRYPRFCGYPTTSATLKHRDQLQNWQGGFISDISLFDNQYFGISAAEAAAMDPQQRLLLMQAVEALNSRGEPVRADRHTGVFVGCCSEDWQRLNSAEGSQAFTATAQSSCMLANRISYCMNFTGPSVTVDTACSSSLVALHCAWQEMTAGGTKCFSTIDTTIVAAINLILTFDTTLALQRSGFLSPSYRCRTFDAAADGFVRSEGAAAVILEKIWRAGCDTASAVSVASEDNVGHPATSPASTSFTGSESVMITPLEASDESRTKRENGALGQRIGIDSSAATESASLSAPCTQEEHAASPDLSQHCEKWTITSKTPRTNVRTPRKAWCRLVGTAAVHGGKTASVTAPCRASQEQLCRRSLSLAGATPDEICYIETHGTGTALGDPIEVAAIVNVFKSNTSSRSSPLILGAVKTNLGHLEGAAGIAGLLKGALCLAHDKVPANLHLKTLNPYIDFQQLPVVLPCKTTPLTLASDSLRAEDNDCNMRGLTKRNRFGCAAFDSSSSTADTCRRLEGSRCIVTSLGFGGTYAQAVLQSVSSSDPTVAVKNILQETPKGYAWKLKRFHYKSPLPADAKSPPPVAFPAYLWRVAWKLLTLDNSQGRSYCMPWRACSNGQSPWLVLCFCESNAVHWKTLDMRDIHVVVQTLSSDISEESLQCLLQSKAWKAVLFVDGVQVVDLYSAMEIFLLSLRVISLCGKLLSRIHPCSKMLLLTRGSQLIQKHTNLSFIHAEDGPPHAAGMLGFTRALRAELSYSNVKSPPLYFVDLDPVTSLNSSVNALPAILQKLSPDEPDVAVRQGNVYVPRLWPAAQLPCDPVRNPEESSSEAEFNGAVNPTLHGEENALSKCSESSCPAWTKPIHSQVAEREPGLGGQLASSCGDELASCACRVRLLAVCADSIRYTADNEAGNTGSPVHIRSLREQSAPFHITRVLSHELGTLVIQKPEFRSTVNEVRGDVLVGCSGIVVAVGKQVEHFRVGDAVCGFVPSSFKKKPQLASTTCSHLLQPIPSSFSFEAAAAIPTQLAHIIRAASLGAHHYPKTSSTCSASETECNISLPHQNDSSQEPLTDTGKTCNACESSTGTFFREQKLAGAAHEPRGSNAGSVDQLYGRAAHSTSEPSGVAEYGRSTKVTSTLQSSARQCAGDGTNRNSEGECAFQNAESTDDEMRQYAHTEAEDDCNSCTRVVDREIRSGGETAPSHTHCSSIDVVIVDGSGAGLTAAIYFRNNGYEVLGVPVSLEHQQALEALNVHVLGAAGVNAEPEEDDTASGLRLALVEIPSAKPEDGLLPSTGSKAVRIQGNADGATTHGSSALSAVKHTTLWAAENGAAQQDAVDEGAQPGETIPSAGPTAAEEMAKASVSDSGPIESSRNPARDYSHERKNCFAKPVGELPAATDFHTCSPRNRLLCCTLRSQEIAERLLPWMVEGSTVYDFSCSAVSREIKKWIHSPPNGVMYCNGADYRPCKNVWSKAFPLHDALRDACNLLKEEFACYSLVELHVFLDSALDEAAAFQEACDFTGVGTHAGNVVFTYSNPILHVPSVFVSSPASNHRDISESPAFTSMEGACATAEEGSGTKGKLLPLPGKSFLHPGPTVGRGREACDLQHDKLFADSPENKRKGFLVTAGSMGGNVCLSAEERRNGTYIVSGEPWGLSAVVARWLVEEGALYVVLLHEENIEGQMEADTDWKWLQGANTAARVVTLTCSFQSKESIHNALSRVRDELHFPPLRGTFHVPCDVQPELENEDSVVDGSRSVLQRKALAAWNLHYALDELQMEDSLQLFVLFSGISGLTGSIKREAACASNTMLDMLACYRSTQGLSGLSIQWASWLADTTTDELSRSRAAAQVCESDPLLSAWLSKGGVTGVPDGLRALRQILTLHLSGQTGAVVACFGVDPALAEGALASDDGWMPKPVASLNVQRTRSPADTGGPPPEPSAASAAVTGDDPSEYRDVLYDLVYREVCSLVGFYVALGKGQKLRTDETLSSLGMDSLTAAELKYELQSRFRVEFDSRMMPQQATIETIAGSIFSHLCFQFCMGFSDDPNSMKNTRDNIAVVSMGLRLPGGCCCPSSLWGMLLASTDCSRGICTFDKPTAHDVRSTRTAKNLSSTRKAIGACYLDGADAFDSDFFGLSVPEAHAMDRQARLLLEVAYEALFNINIRDSEPQCGSSVAVYTTGFVPRQFPAAVQDEEPYNRMLQPPPPRTANDKRPKSPSSCAKPELVQPLYRSNESLPGLISYFLSLSGTSVSICAGGASSLLALCLAADHLGSNTEAEAALVGAVRLLPVELQNFSVSLGYPRRANASVTGSSLARATTDDSCAFDQIQGEGVLAVVLQKQRIAETSANPVLATIRGRSMKHMGRHGTANKGAVGSCTAAVRSVLEGALACASATRRDVALVEVAGVGLSAHPHHPEWEAIAQVYGKERSTANEFPIVVSSIKGNVGCLGEAAGLAGFLKVVLMLGRGGGSVVVPPSLRLKQICKSMRNIATNGCGGLLFPSKPLVRGPAPAASVSLEGRSCLVGRGFSVPAEESHAATETLFSASKQSVQHTTGPGATSSIGNLRHPHEARSSSTRQSFASLPGASTYSLPSDERCENSARRAILRQKREDKVLGGVTASAPSGFVVHMLIEGAASTLDHTVSFTRTPPGENSSQHLPIPTAPGAATAANSGSVAGVVSDSCSACTADYGAAGQPTTGGCLNAVSSGKRCLWLFSNDCTKVLYCGRPLYFTSNIFARELDRCSELMSMHLPASLRQLLYPTCEAELLASEKFLSQPCVAALSLFALQWSLASYLRQTSQGRSIAVTGVGTGEIVAAAVAGLLSLDEAINLMLALGNTRESHTHTNDLQASTTVSDEKFLSGHADTRLFPMHSSFSQGHTAASVDYGLSTDGEQTNRSDCFSLYDGTDASCRSLFWKYDAIPTNGLGREQEQSGIGFASLSPYCTEQSEEKQHQAEQSQSSTNPVSALSAAPSKEDDDGKRYLQEQAVAVETPTCHLSANGRPQEMLKQKSSLPADTGVSTTVAVSRSSALHAAAGEVPTSMTASRTLVGHDDILRSFTAPVSNEIRQSAFRETTVYLPERAVGHYNGREASRAVDSETSKIRLCDNNLVQERRRGSCCLPASRHAPTPTLRCRAGSLLDLKVTDTPQHSVTPSFCIPSLFPSSSFTELADTPTQRRTSVDDFLRSTDTREEEPLRDGGWCRSMVNKAAVLSFPQVFTPTPRERRTSLQYVTPRHAKISSQTTKTARLVGSDTLPIERRGSHFDKHSDNQAAGDIVPLSLHPGNVAEESRPQENKLCCATPGGRTPLRSPSISQLVAGTDTPSARSGLIYTVSGKDRVLASSHKTKDAHARNFSTSNVGVDGCSEGRPRCLRCEEIRSIVGKISVKKAACVFLSAALGTAVPDRLLRNPLYWYTASPQKLHLRTTVKVAKKVLRTAAVVVLGPPAAGPLHPGTLLKLAKHVEIFRFTGRSDSLEAVIPCEVSTSIERAAAVCSDIVLRVPHAAPCWKHIHTHPLGANKLDGINGPSDSVSVSRQLDQRARQTAQGRRRGSAGRFRALSE